MTLKQYGMLTKQVYFKTYFSGMIFNFQIWNMHKLISNLCIHIFISTVIYYFTLL